MGCGSRAGKMEQHAAGKPAVQESLCRGCHRCAKAVSYTHLDVYKRQVLAYARDFMINKGFTYVIPPFMMHGNVVQGVMLSLIHI